MLGCSFAEKSEEMAKNTRASRAIIFMGRVVRGLEISLLPRSTWWNEEKGEQ